MGRHDAAKFRRELERRGASGAGKAGKARDRVDEALRRELLLCAAAVETRCAKRRCLDGPGAEGAPQDAVLDAPSAAGGDEPPPQPSARRSDTGAAAPGAPGDPSPDWVRAHVAASPAPPAFVSPPPARAGAGDQPVFKRRRAGDGLLSPQPQPTAQQGPHAVIPPAAAPSPSPPPAPAESPAESELPSLPAGIIVSRPATGADEAPTVGLPVSDEPSEPAAVVASPAAQPAPSPVVAEDADVASPPLPPPSSLGATPPDCGGASSAWLPPPSELPETAVERMLSMQRRRSVAAAAAAAAAAAVLASPPPVAVARAMPPPPPRAPAAAPSPRPSPRPAPRRRSGGGRTPARAAGASSPPHQAVVSPPAAALPSVVLDEVLSQPWPAAAAAAAPASAWRSLAGASQQPSPAEWRSARRGRPAARGTIEACFKLPTARPSAPVSAERQRRPELRLGGTPQASPALRPSPAQQPPPPHKHVAAVSAMGAAGRALELQPSRGVVAATAAAAEAAKAAAAAAARQAAAPPSRNAGAAATPVDDDSDPLAFLRRVAVLGESGSAESPPQDDDDPPDPAPAPIPAPAAIPAAEPAPDVPMAPVAAEAEEGSDVEVVPESLHAPSPPADVAPPPDAPPAVGTIDDDETVDPTAGAKRAAPAAVTRPQGAAPRTPPSMPPGARRCPPFATLLHAGDVRCVVLAGSAAHGWAVATLCGVAASAERTISLWRLPGEPTMAHPGALAGCVACPASDEFKFKRARGGAAAADDPGAAEDTQAISLSPDGRTVYALGRLVSRDMQASAAGSAPAAVRTAATVVALSFDEDCEAGPSARALLRLGLTTLGDGAERRSCVACFRAAPLASGGGPRTLVVAAGSGGAAASWDVHGPLAAARGTLCAAALPVAHLHARPLTDIVALAPVQGRDGAPAQRLLGTCSSGAAALWDLAAGTLLCAWYDLDTALRAVCPLLLPGDDEPPAPDDDDGSRLDASLWAVTTAQPREPGAASPPAAALARLRVVSGGGGAATVARAIPLPRPVTALASRDGVAAAGLAGGGVVLWHAVSGRQCAALGGAVERGDCDDVTSLAWAVEPRGHDARRRGTGAGFAVADRGGRVELFDLDLIEPE